MNGNDKELVKVAVWMGPSLLLVVAGHAPGLVADCVLGALLRGEDCRALGAVEIRISRQSAAFVDVRQAQRVRHGAVLLIIQALAFAVLEVVVNDSPDPEIAGVAVLAAVETEIGDVDVAGDEEGVGASNERGSSGDN